MAEGYLTDTSAVIKYLNGTLPDKAIRFMDRIADDFPVISFITEIELQVWSPPAPEDLEIYNAFISGCEIIGINQPIIAATIELRKSEKLKLPDAIIAATALVNNYTLIADNDKDFNKVSALKYLNPRFLSEP